MMNLLVLVLCSLVEICRKLNLLNNLSHLGLPTATNTAAAMIQKFIIEQMPTKKSLSFC